MLKLIGVPLMAKRQRCGLLPFKALKKLVCSLWLSPAACSGPGDDSRY